MLRKIALAGALALGLSSAALAQTHTDTAGTIIPGVSAGQIKEVCVTPTVTTANAYGANYVVGGLLTFALALPPSGGGSIQSVYVQTNTVESNGFTFTPFSAQPSASTWTDAAVAAITGADKKLARGAISLAASSALGTYSTISSVGIGQVINAGATTLYGVLTSNGALSSNFTTTGDVTVCIDVLQFP